MLPCVVLCGGLATRLRPLTETIPKSLVDINGEPFIAHQLRLLKSSGVEDVVLCIGHLGEMVEEYAGHGQQFGLKIRYSHDGETLLGTAGAIRKALPLLDHSFFVLYGDSYLPCDYSAVAATHGESGRCGLMTIYKNAGTFDDSNVEAKEGRILRYDKKNKSVGMQYIDYGLGVFRRSVFEAPQSSFSFDLSEVYKGLLDSDELACFEVSERFYEIGSQAGILDLATYLSKKTPLFH